MSLRLGALYDALLTAQGVSPDDAKKAAEEVAGYDNRLAAIDTKLAVIQALLGIVITLLLVVLGKLFT